jgi:hypothetical protein
MSFVIIFSTNQELFFKTNFNNIPKTFTFELMKKVKNVNFLFQTLLRHENAKLSNDILTIKFQENALKKEFLVNFQLFYPDEYENLHNDTQHLMNNEIIYSIIDDNILMGELSHENDIICCDKHVGFQDFIKFHYQILGRKMTKEKKELKIKRNGKYLPLKTFL